MACSGAGHLRCCRLPGSVAPAVSGLGRSAGWPEGMDDGEAAGAAAHAVAGGPVPGRGRGRGVVEAVEPVQADTEATRISRMITASLAWPRNADNSAVTASSSSSGERSWPRSTGHARARYERTAFGPATRSRRAASSAGRPLAPVPSRARTSSAPSAAACATAIDDGTVAPSLWPERRLPWEPPYPTGGLPQACVRAHCPHRAQRHDESQGPAACRTLARQAHPGPSAGGRVLPPAVRAEGPGVHSFLRAAVNVQTGTMDADEGRAAVAAQPWSGM
jgi:hypothetical protein